MTRYDNALARARAKANQFLTDRCAIERPRQKTDEYGTPRPEWIVIGTGIPCRVIGSGSNVGGAMIAANQEVLTDSYRIALEAGTDIQADDRIIVAGVIYGVMRIEQRLTAEFWHMVLCERKEGSDDD